METARRNAEDFLAPHNLSLSHIQQCVGEPLPWEALIFGGSIPEGLANADSDIDLLLLGDTDLVERNGSLPPIQAGDIEIAFQPNLGSLRVQIETVRISHLELLAKRMSETVVNFRNPESADRVYAFDDLDLRVMHRIRTGIPLRNECVASKWKTRLSCDFLSTYLVSYAVAQHVNLREDVLGEARQGRRESSRWLLSYAVSFAAAALLASVGETNPNAKWRVRLLQVRGQEAGAELAGALIERLIAPTFADFETSLKDTLELCDRAVETALSRHPDLVKRRKTMLAKGKKLGILLPGTEDALK